MKDMLTLRTVRKKLLMLSKLAGLLLVFSCLFFHGLPISQDLRLWLWLGCVLLLVLLMDFLMGHLISKPLSRLNAAAKRMARLDFSEPCRISSADEFAELSDSLHLMSENLQQALARLEAANAQLEQEVEKERLLLQERRELVDSLSHEMKTPLGIIRAYAEGLPDETDETKRQRYARVIASETERMNHLIVTLLDLSALESGASRLSITRFDFVELLETVAGRLLMDAPDNDFELQYEIPEEKICVYSDPQRMEQVLDNLIVNARKHVRAGGILRLELTETGHTLHFSVFNQGRLIPKADLPRIWTRFYRGKDASCSGSGLGLSIVAQILSMQKLPYAAENLADGVRFSFSMPVDQTFHTDLTADSPELHRTGLNSPYNR